MAGSPIIWYTVKDEEVIVTAGQGLTRMSLKEDEADSAGSAFANLATIKRL
jgi:hypothetical protein